MGKEQMDVDPGDGDEGSNIIILDAQLMEHMENGGACLIDMDSNGYPVLHIIHHSMSAAVNILKYGG